MVNYIICEFNPLHNGHAHLLRSVSLLPQSEGTVCIMSSHLTQRGAFSISDKWTRAEMALCCGADLVLELGASFSGAAAGRFAEGGVQIAKATGLGGRLCFGTEGDVLPELTALSEIDDNALHDIVKQQLDSGKSYAAAVGIAYGALHPNGAELLQTPNNLLALEYLKAIRKYDAPLTPWSTPRKGAAHNEMKNKPFASASFIRERLAQNRSFKKYMPTTVYNIFLQAKKEGRLLDANKADLLCMAHLRNMTLAQWQQVRGTEDGLAERFYKYCADAQSTEQLLDNVKTKRFTHARLRRIAMHAYLDLSPVSDLEPAYLRVLGLNEKGQALLRQMKQTASLPLLIKTADSDTLSKEGKALLAAEAKVTDRFMFCLQNAGERSREFTTSPIIKK